MNVRLTSKAWADLHDIGDWIAQHNPDAAIKLTDDLLDKALAIGDAPFRYPQVAELDRADLRKRSHRNYVIIFRVVGEVEVLRIVHVRRDYLSLVQDV